MFEERKEWKRFAHRPVKNENNDRKRLFEPPIKTL
jgi:hypothetical protein